MNEMPWEMDWDTEGSPAYGGAPQRQPPVPRATTYSPQRGGDQMEGGYEAARPGPDGQAVVRTLEDFRTGASPYVTVAGNPSLYGRQYTMPEVSYQVGGQRYTLKDVPVVVHDTGGAFKTAPEGRFDVPIGRDLGARDTNQGLSGVQFIPRGSAPMAFTGEPSRPAGVQAIEGAIRPVPGADPIPPRPTMASASQDTRMPWEMDWPDAAPQAAAPQHQSDLMPWEMDWSGNEPVQKEAASPLQVEGATPSADDLKMQNLREGLRPYTVSGQKHKEPAQWDVMGVPMAPKPDAPPPDDGEDKVGGIWNNLTSRVNNWVYSGAGGPVDLAAGVINEAGRQVRERTGATVQEITDPIGGKGSITRAFERIGVNNPENVVANTLEERIARGVGEGVGSMIVPAMGVGVLNRAGVLSKAAQEAVTPFVGEESARAMAANAAIGGAAGGVGTVGGDIAAGAGGEKFRPLGEFAGNVLGGVAGAGMAVAPRAVSEGSRMAMDHLLPTRASQERAAGAVIRDAATDPYAVRDALAEGATEIIPGSRPTTFQATGDMGLGSLEAGVATKNRDAFQQRTAEQNIARREVLGSIEPGGYPEAVSRALREQLDIIDQMTAQAVDEATGRAVQGTRALGGDLPPEAYGASLRDIERPIVQGAEADAQAAMRAAGGLDEREFYGAGLRNKLADAREVAKQRESVLHDAVDPGGRLNLAAGETTRTAREVSASLPSSARPIEGEEVAILAVANGYAGQAVPYRELAALRSRLRDAAWEERQTKGRTVKYGRLARLQSAIERDLETAVLRQAEDEAQMIASGVVALEDTLLGRVQAVASGGGAGEWPGPTAAARGPAAPIGGASSAAGKPDAVLLEAADIALGRRAPYRPPSFLRWIGARGGVRPDANVVSVLDAADRRHGGILSSAGRSVDEMGMAIAERGGMRERPDENQILDWISEAANGRDPDWWIAMHASPEREEAARIAATITRLAADQGVPLRSRQVAFDLLNQEAALYGDAPPHTIAANLQSRVRSSHGRSPAEGFATEGAGAGRGSMGPRAGEVAAEIPPGGMAGYPRDAGTRGQAGWGPGSSPGGEGVPPPGVVAPASFGEEDLARMRAANAATRARAETFDTGPVGRVLESSGPADRFRMSESAVPRALFRPGLEGFHAVQAFRKAVGDDAAAIHLLQQAAVRDLRDTAMRPNGTLDPDAYGRWRAKYADAIRAFPDFLKSIGTAERASRLLDDARLIPEGVLDADVGGKVFRSGPGGYESVTNFVRAMGDDRAKTILEDYAINRLRDFAEMKGGDLAGTLDPKRVEMWRARHKEALRALPEVDAKLADPVAASEAIATLAQARKEALDGYQSGVFGRLIGVDDPQDVVKTVGGIFGRQDAVAQMRKLVSETAGNPDARQGLRKAVSDYITKRFISNTEGATSDVDLIRAGQFQSFVKDSRNTLRTLFTDPEVEMMSRIADDLHRANRSSTAARIPGQSNTAGDTGAAGRATTGEPQSILSILMRAGAVGAAGGAVGGFLPGVAGAAVIGIAGAMRNAGIKNADAILRDAMLDPKLASVLLERSMKVTPRQALNLRNALMRASVAPSLSE
ncbi:hypothetical protein ACI7BZ_12175 [Xanthobacter sp. AM11]|uniref:hypothetical protein n=1 Tax=Xanthobacter sp. AM11 TaxID=3380643 RepID=UPI0039BF09E4